MIYPSGLKACPFCGSDEIDPSYWASEWSNGPGCSKCGATAEDADGWNERASETELADALTWLLPLARGYAAGRDVAANTRIIQNAFDPPLLLAVFGRSPHSPPAQGDGMTEEEFCTRFVAEMMTVAPIYDGTPDELRAYAEEAAPTYFSEPDQRAEGPEACAQSDIGYWEE